MSTALLPCYERFQRIGAACGFPVRFKNRASDDPEFKTGVILLLARPTITLWPISKIPGLQPFTTEAQG